MQIQGTQETKQNDGVVSEIASSLGERKVGSDGLCCVDDALLCAQSRAYKRAERYRSDRRARLPPGDSLP